MSLSRRSFLKGAAAAAAVPLAVKPEPKMEISGFAEHAKGGLPIPKSASYREVWRSALDRAVINIDPPDTPFIHKES